MKHKDKHKRNRNLARATTIKGKWRNDKYSPNNLAYQFLNGINIIYFSIF
jgi:hypothetical protein